MSRRGALNKQNGEEPKNKWMNNSFNCDVNVRVKLKVRERREESCGVAAESAWIWLLDCYFYLRPFQLWANFYDMCHTFMAEAEHNRSLCCCCNDTRLHRVPSCPHEPGLREQEWYQRSQAWSPGGGMSKPVICMQEPQILLISRKETLQQQAAMMMMRSPDTASEKSLRLLGTWNFIWTMAQICWRNWRFCMHVY